MTSRVTYVGHATVRIDLGGVSLLTDPAIRDRILRWVIKRQVPPPRPESLELLDAVLVSHLHPDHLDFPSLRSLGDVPIVAPRGSARTFRRRGYLEVTELAPGEATRIGDVEVGAVPAEHDGRRYKLGPRVEAIGFDIRGDGRRLWFAGDTDLFDGMADLAGDLDVALLPIGGWGPRVGRGHLDPERAARAAAMAKPRIAVPIHWGTLLRTELARRRPELLSRPPREFERRIAELAPGVESRVIAPSESTEI